jgi:cobalt/nickel transport system permease protein
MHFNLLDPFHEGHSLVHALDSRIKFVLVVAFILTSALVPVGAWPVYLILAALVLSAEMLSELGLRFYLKRSLLALPFVLAALPLLVTIPGAGLAYLPFGLVVSAEGTARFVSVALKSWISVQAAVLLATTTTFPEIIIAMRALHMPQLLVAIISLMWRYLFVMADEALRLTRARAARSGEMGDHKPGGSIAWRARVTGGMAGNLFLRSLERSDRIYMAMLSRGYDGEVRSLPLPAISPAGWGTLLIVLVLLAGLLALGFLL